MSQPTRENLRSLLALCAALLLAPLAVSCAGGSDSLPRWGVVGGTVVDDATSLGVTGATVTVGGVAATTGATGSFTARNVPTGRQNYTVAASGYRSIEGQSIEVRANNPARMDVRLISNASATGEIYGAVTDAISAAPIASVTVTVGTASTVTSQDGVYSLLGIATGDQGVTFSKAGYVSRQETVTVAGGGRHELNVTLAPVTTGSIAGTVTDGSTGAALADVAVSIEALASTTTAANGTYRLDDIPAGVWVVRYARTNYRTVERSVTVSPEQTTTQDVAMLGPSQGALEGQVRNQTSGGLQAGVHVTVVELERATDTDANGYYSFPDLPTGVYTVLFALTDYGSLSRTNIEIEGGKTTTLDVELAPTVGGLVGWVWEENPQTGGHGPPVADASVRVGNDLTIRTTDAFGHYEVHDVPAIATGTTYTVYAWSPTHDLAQVQVTLRAGEIVQVPDIELHPAQ